jgi:Helix-turn-helix domain
MSIKVITYVWEHSTHTGSDLLMLHALAYHANDEGIAWPSLTKLAQKCRVLKRQAIRTIQNLEHAGTISIERGHGRNHPSVYTIKGVTDDTLPTKGVIHDTIQPNKGVIDDTIQSEKMSPTTPFVTLEKVSPTTPFVEIKGVIQDTKGVIQGTAREPSLEPSEEKPQTHIRVMPKKGKPLAPDYTPGFLQFWDVYPHERYAKKPTCFKVWQEYDLESRTAEIVEKVERLKVTRWHDKSPNYIPLTSSWLNSGDFNTELIPIPRAVNGMGRLSEKEQRSAAASRRILEDVQHGDEGPGRVPRRLNEDERHLLR